MVPRPDRAPTAVASADMAVPPGAVWALRLNFANLPDYNPDVTDVERVHDGDPGGAGGICGPGARYRFQLADTRRPGRTRGVELWCEEVEEPTLVVAAMVGGNEAYEEFLITPLGPDASRATLTLWVTLPDGLAPEAHEAVAAGSLAQIDKELVLMKQILEGRAGGPSVH
jgi:hypothetical protein